MVSRIKFLSGSMVRIKFLIYNKQMTTYQEVHHYLWFLPLPWQQLVSDTLSLFQAFLVVSTPWLLRSNYLKGFPFLGISSSGSGPKTPERERVRFKWGKVNVYIRLRFHTLFVIFLFFFEILNPWRLIRNGLEGIKIMFTHWSLLPM